MTPQPEARCGEVNKTGGFVCTRPAEHEGGHIENSFAPAPAEQPERTEAGERRHSPGPCPADRGEVCWECNERPELAAPASTGEGEQPVDRSMFTGAPVPTGAAEADLRLADALAADVGEWHAFVPASNPRWCNNCPQMKEHPVHGEPLRAYKEARK